MSQRLARTTRPHVANQNVQIFSFLIPALSRFVRHEHVALDRGRPEAVAGLRYERVLHLFDDLVKEQIGQLRVKHRLELERDHEIDYAGLRDVLEARAELPRRQQVVEQPPVHALGLDQRWFDQRYVRGVTFVQRWKSDYQVGLQRTGLAGVHVRFFTKRDKGVVLFDVRHHAE